MQRNISVPSTTYLIFHGFPEALLWIHNASDIVIMELLHIIRSNRPFYTSVKPKVILDKPVGNVEYVLKQTRTATSRGCEFQITYLPSLKTRPPQSFTMPLKIGFVDEVPVDFVSRSIDEEMHLCI
jgi:hypothetical protein